MFRKLSLSLAVLGFLFAATFARADEWDKKTTITFSQPVELPGVVLPAGTYVFKLFDSLSTRDIVQVFNADESKIYATIIGIPHLHLTPHDKTYIGFEERPSSAPQALHEWFYPGNTNGIEFVYPKGRAMELARETGRPVLAAEVTPAMPTAELEKAPVVAETPENKETAVAETTETMPSPLEAAPATPAIAVPAPEPVLPKTASPLPLIALGGLLSFGVAAAMRGLAR